MKYLRKFETTAAYEAAKDNLALPNVSYITESNGVHYKPVPPHDYSQDYLTTVALSGGTISFNIWYSMGTDKITSISYSTDDGETWNTTNNVNNKTENLQITVNVEEGDKVLWKGIASRLGDTYNGSFFSSSCEFNIEGNAMSMLYGDNFFNQANLSEKPDGAFYKLFKDCTELINANNLSLPATTLSAYCYGRMFNDCTKLITAPSLPATTLAGQCYTEMFQGCTSLTTAPQLPAATLSSSCYYAMFSGCTSLIMAPELPATTLANSCYESMFNSCRSITILPHLSATTLVYGCYNNMFGNCSGITSIPSDYLPVTTLADRCYNSMFQYTNITVAPNLPATTLQSSCYSYMFRGCTNLTTAPELSATTLEYGCYQGMFQGCTSLNSITCLATDISASYCTNNWVSGVANSGTFTKAASMSSWTTGNNGTPSNWTVTDAS